MVLRQLAGFFWKAVTYLGAWRLRRWCQTSGQRTGEKCPCRRPRRPRHVAKQKTATGNRSPVLGILLEEVFDLVARGFDTYDDRGALADSSGDKARKEVVASVGPAAAANWPPLTS